MKIVNWFQHHKVEVLLVSLILIIGGFLRFYEVGDWMHFGQDEGRDAFVIGQIATAENLPWLGPAAPNNSEDFHLGPAYYYLLTPFYWLSGLSPVGGAAAIALFSFFSIFLVYLVGRNFFGWLGSLVAAGLFSVSFLMVYYGRWAWNPNLVPFFILLIFLAMFKLAQLKKQPNNECYLYLLAVALGLVIQLHGTALIVLPVILLGYLVVFRPKIAWQKYLLAILIVVILNLPIIAYDLTHNLANTRGFWHIMTQSDSGSSISLTERVSRLLRLTKDFWQEDLLHGRQTLLFYILSVGSIGFLLFKIFLAVKNKRRDIPTVLFALWLFVPLGIFVFYKEAIPTHYYCLIFPLPFLLLAWMFVSLGKNWWLKIIFLGLVLMIFCGQLYYSVNLLRDLSPVGSRASSYPITLNEMKQAAVYIIADSSGAEFNLSATNYYRGFEYLFSQYGVEPSTEPVDRQYEIVIGGQEGKIFGNLGVINNF